MRLARRIAVIFLASAVAVLASSGVAVITAPHSLAASANLSSRFRVRGPGSAHFATTFDVSTFQKGNLHTHTYRSDGVNSPEDVIYWYRANGYKFLALTDHNLYTAASAYPELQDDGFRLIAGEEISMVGAGRQVHVNALCTQQQIGGGNFGTAADALVWATSEVNAQHGLALINHPNFDAALSPTDLLSVPEAPLLEIWSGHPYVYTAGVDGRPSHEALWDAVLLHGLGMMGVAVDDTHRLDHCGNPPAYPGRGWVEVFSTTNDPAAVCESLRNGMFFATNGVALARIRVTSRTYAVWPTRAATVEFLAAGGTVLGETHVSAGQLASYTLLGHEAFVRARIRSDGNTAWTPAVRVTSVAQPEP